MRFKFIFNEISFVLYSSQVNVLIAIQLDIMKILKPYVVGNKYRRRYK